MTDHERDELASAYLDGEATPDEVARVEGDPDLLARVAELRAVARAVASVDDTAGAAHGNAAIAKAMDAFVPQEKVVPLARRRPRPRVAALSVAAALLLAALAAALVPLIANGNGDGADGGDVAATADDAAEQRSSDSEAVEDSGAGAGEATQETMAAPALHHLGPIDDRAGLVAAVEARTAESEAALPTTSALVDVATSGAAVSRCVEVLVATNPDRGEPTFTATADYEGTRAAVIVFESGGRRQVVAADLSDCRVLASAEL